MFRWLRTFWRWLRGERTGAPPQKVEWTDRRLPPVAVTIAGGLAYESFMVVDRPEALQVYDALLVDKEMVLVREIRAGRVWIDRAIGGTEISPHRPGVVAAILGPVMPMSTLVPPPLREANR